MADATNPSDVSPGEPQPVFAARLTPHRSLSRNSFTVMMLVFAALAFSSAAAFFVMGAWPILVFLVLDVGLIWVAFEMNYRSGKAYEDVVVTPNRLTIRRVSGWGRETIEELHPVWTRLKTAYDPEEERVLAVKLESKGKQVPVGAFMNPDDKESFANALGPVLDELRRGGRPPALASALP
ncbi:MAG: DUF2244 domain-containing protein [Devosiaceae bacterium]|nr:DUF2244 domain-containing protein [Devosiaceae bacterium MH13]